MTGTQILNELDDLRAYAERLEEDIEYREEILEDDKKKLADTERRIQQLENEAKNYWRKSE